MRVKVRFAPFSPAERLILGFHPSPLFFENEIHQKQHRYNVDQVSN